jgi:diguanylate cyclase (GGDEF)-like protein/PAS domain S-box-containing protein
VSPHLSATARNGLSVPRETEVELFSLGGHDGYLREVNEAFATLLGRRTDEVNGRSLLEFVHPDDLVQIVGGIAALERGEPEVMMENRFLQADRRAVHLQWVARPVPGTDTWWAAGRNTTEFHLLLAQRLDLRASLDLALGQSIAALWDLDVKTGVFTWEPQAAELLGVAADALPITAQDLADTVNPEDSAGLLEAVQALTASGVAEVGVRVGQDATLRYLSLRGKVLTRDRRGRPLRAVGLVLDVTAEKAMEEQMLRMVMSDALTGVPNRRAFDQALRTQWRRCTRALQPLSVLMIDIDNFKRFNDTFGHQAGDAALIAVARALSNCLHRAGDVLARYGGEEFAVVMPGVDAQAALDVADRLVQTVRGVTVRQAAGWNATVSVGAATWFPGSAAAKSSELLALADTALYAAKAAGKDRALACQDCPDGSAAVTEGRWIDEHESGSR